MPAYKDVSLGLCHCPPPSENQTHILTLARSPDTGSVVGSRAFQVCHSETTLLEEALESQSQGPLWQPW